MQLLDGVTATITDIALVNEIDGPAGRLFVWAYNVRFRNLTTFEVTVSSRAWRITDADGREKTVFHGPDAAPLLTGNIFELDIPPENESWFYEAGIASFSSGVHLEGGYKAHLGDQEGLIKVDPSDFLIPFSHTPHPICISKAYLTEADSIAFEEVVLLYADRARNGKAALHSRDMKNLSNEGAQLITAALIYDGNLHDEKIRRFDLSGLVAGYRRYKFGFRLASTDNYMIVADEGLRSDTTFAPAGVGLGPFVTFSGTPAEYESILKTSVLDLYCEAEARKIHNNYFIYMSRTQQTDELCRQFLTLLGVPADLQPKSLTHNVSD